MRPGQKNASVLLYHTGCYRIILAKVMAVRVLIFEKRGCAVRQIIF